jgi:hypothetical protein
VILAAQAGSITISTSDLTTWGLPVLAALAALFNVGTAIFHFYTSRQPNPVIQALIESVSQSARRLDTAGAQLNDRFKDSQEQWAKALTATEQQYAQLRADFRGLRQEIRVDTGGKSGTIP